MSRIQFDFMIDLPARDRQGVEGCDRPRCVTLEVVEERRRKAVANTFEDVQVNLHQLLDLVEHAPDHRRRRVTREFFDFAIRQQVDVELGAHALDETRQRHARFARCNARRVEVKVAGQEIVKQRHAMLRRDRQSIEDHHRFDLAFMMHATIASSTLPTSTGS